LGLKYVDFQTGICEFEKENWFGEVVYFAALERLRPFGSGSAKLKQQDVMGVIRMFLIQWGQMARAVNREGTDWNLLWSRLNGISPVLEQLRCERILDVKLESKRELISEAYESLESRNIGATSVSKILHLINPELFVMWDDNIRINESNKLGFKLNGERRLSFAEGLGGYLKYLRACQAEVKTALEDGKSVQSETLGDVLQRLLAERPEVEPSKLGPEYMSKTLAKLMDEYNWWAANM
jgi:hypothetical protein